MNDNCHQCHRPMFKCTCRPMKESDFEKAEQPLGQWSAADYERSAKMHEAAEAITKRLTEHAVRLAIIRHDLLSFNPDGRDEELTEDEVVADLISVALGEDTGCLDPDSLDATNCEVLFVEEQLRQLFPTGQTNVPQMGQPPESVTRHLDKLEALSRAWSGVLGGRIAPKVFNTVFQEYYGLFHLPQPPVDATAQPAKEEL